MADQSVPVTNVLNRTGGRWARGRARLLTATRLPGWGFDINPPGVPGDVLLVGYDLPAERPPERSTPWETYPLTAHARTAARALRVLCDAPDRPAAVRQFVGRYGLLYLPDGARLLWREPNLDRFRYVQWCRDSGRDHDAAFFRWWEERAAGRPAPGTDRAGLMVWEPVALFIWASQQLTILRDQMMDGLAADMEHWLDDKLAALRVQYSGRPGRLAIAARSLLAYLTTQTVLDVYGEEPELRSCRSCGLPLTNGRARLYCGSMCRERLKKRRARAKAAM